MRCQIKAEAFFVPLRLLAGSFESWFTDTPVSFQGDSTSYLDKVGYLPVIGNVGGSTVGPDGTTPLIAYLQKTGSLFDYLGMKTGQAFWLLVTYLLCLLSRIIVCMMTGIVILWFSALSSFVLILV